MGFSLLEIGKRGLGAQRFGLDITSNNIANVNTRGYARQIVTLQATTPIETAQGFIGTGVEVGAVGTARSEFFDREIRNSLSSQSGFETDGEIVQRLEAIFGETSDFSLDTTMQRFFAAFEDLSLRPENLDKRKLVLAEARNVVTQFNSIGLGMENLRSDVRNRASDTVDTINEYLEDIAALNQQISTARARGDNSALDLADKRANLLEDLSELAEVKVYTDTNGQTSVSIGDSTVVTGASFSVVALNETVDAISGERTLRLVDLNADGLPRAVLSVNQGQLGALLKNYNVTLDGNDSSGGFSVVADLNSLAEALVETVNALHETGFGLDDAGPASPGRSFFEPGGLTDPVTAISIAIGSDVLDQPRNIAAAATANAPGDNEIARQIASLIDDENFIGTSSAIEFYSGVIAEVGALGRDAATGASTVEVIRNQLFAQRDSEIGVSLDEEAVSLIKFQRAFEASARVVSIADEILDVVVNLGR